VIQQEIQIVIQVLFIGEHTDIIELHGDIIITLLIYIVMILLLRVTTHLQILLLQQNMAVETIIL